MPDLAPIVIISTEHHVGFDFVEDFSAQGSVDHVPVLGPTLVNDQPACLSLPTTVSRVKSKEGDMSEQDSGKSESFY